jgi:hypothetical protein
MHQCHPYQQRNHAGHHHLVLWEEPLSPYIATTDTGYNESQGKSGRPPAHQECRVIIQPCPNVRGRLRIDPSCVQHRLV